MKTQFKDEDFKTSTKTCKTWLVKTCVEVAKKDDIIAVRNSNDATKNTVFFTPNEWDAFIKGVKENEFDLDSF